MQRLMRKKDYDAAQFIFKKIQAQQVTEMIESDEKRENMIMNLIYKRREKQFAEYQSTQAKIETGLKELIKNKDIEFERLLNKVSFYHQTPFLLFLLETNFLQISFLKRNLENL